jgi:hypothetical protein
MISVAVAECEILPLVPLTVNVYVPVGAVRFGETFSVDVPEVVMVDGVKLELTFFGNPLTVKLTVPENGPMAPIVTE